MVELFRLFKHMHSRESSSNISLSVSVLTMGFWPTYPTVTASLPVEVNRLVFECKDCRLRFLALPFARDFHEILFKQIQWKKTALAIYT